MTIGYVSGSAASEDGGATTVTLPSPGGIVAGNLLVAVEYVPSSTAPTSSVAAPDGWTVAAQQASTTAGFMTLYTKTATAAEPASYTFTGPGTQSVVVLQYQGASGIDTALFKNATTATTAGTVTSARPAQPAEMEVVVYGSTVGAVWGTPTGADRRQYTVGTNDSLYAFDKRLATDIVSSTSANSTQGTSAIYCSVNILLSSSPVPLGGTAVNSSTAVGRSGKPRAWVRGFASRLGSATTFARRSLVRSYGIIYDSSGGQTTGGVPNLRPTIGQLWPRSRR